ncbi:MAG: hypothetical protein KJ623_00090 [Nanoarchaeota archaeon]|nr:hypothetical protein [Nanoarchaeota archaeon]MBU0963289.1 hypothetical protein [Nanoarchaeota archaeon]
MNKGAAKYDSALLKGGTTCPNISWIDLPSRCNADYSGLLERLAKIIPKHERLYEEPEIRKLGYNLFGG